MQPKLTAKEVDFISDLMNLEGDDYFNRSTGEKGNVLFKDADGRNSGKRNENDSLQPR